MSFWSIVYLALIPGITAVPGETRNHATGSQRGQAGYLADPGLQVGQSVLADGITGQMPWQCIQKTAIGKQGGELLGKVGTQGLLRL